VIAARLGVHVDTVRKWRRRFCEHGIDGLTDRARSGRPRRFSAPVVAGVKALACELPAQSGTALARWSCPELAREAVGRGIAAACTSAAGATGPSARTSSSSASYNANYSAPDDFDDLASLAARLLAFKPLSSAQHG
jgi:hypothetical protein